MLVHDYITGRTAVKIAAGIEACLRAGRLKPGALLPPVRRLARSLGVSPATVLAAYRELRLRGLLTGEGRRGSRIAARPALALAVEAPIAPGVRDLSDGNPAAELLPALRPVLSRLGRVPVLYGAPVALPELLKLGRRDFEADAIPAENIAVVGGSLDGIERVVQAQLRSGDRVAVEDPGFPRVFDLLLALGLRLVAVAVDDDGPRPQALAQALRSGVQAFIVTPRAQNPTGAALSAERAEELRQVLRAYPDCLVIEDDHAGMVCGAPATSLVEPGCARWAVLRSVSKWLGPDLRLALMAGDATTVARVEGRRLLGTGWVSHLLQRLVVGLWSAQSTLELLQRAARVYAERRQALLAALAQHGLTARGRSGLNVWVEVPEEAAVVQALLKAGWAVAAGERFRLQSRPAVRVTASSLEPAEASALARHLARCLEQRRRTPQS